MSPVCLSVCHVKCPQNWSFYLKKKTNNKKNMLLILSCCHNLDWCWPWCQSIESLWVLPQLDVTVVSNYLCCQCGEWPTSESQWFLFVLQFIHAGLGHVDQRLACVFNQSCCVGLLWMGWMENDRTSLVIPGWPPSEKEGKLSHRPLWGEQLAVPVEMPRISLFLYFSTFVFFYFLLSS